MVQVFKTIFRFIQNFVISTEGTEQIHQMGSVEAGKLISIPVNFYVLLFQAREVFVQRRIIVFPVTFPESQTHIKADDPFDIHLRTGIQD